MGTKLVDTLDMTSYSFVGFKLTVLLKFLVHFNLHQNKHVAKKQDSIETLNTEMAWLLSSFFGDPFCPLFNTHTNITNVIFGSTALVVHADLG